VTIDCFLMDVSDCEKPTGISRVRAKRKTLKPTSSPQEPTEEYISKAACSHKRRGRHTLTLSSEKPTDAAVLDRATDVPLFDF
jgi:hypothetical protein